MIICNSRMYVVYHLEKTGGTTIEKSLEPFLLDDDIYLRDWQRINITDSGMNINEHGIPLDVRSLLIGSSFYSFKHFSTVREPVALMTSMYRYAKNVYSMTPPGENVSGAMTAYALSLQAGSERFLEYLFSNDYRMVQSQASRLKGILLNGMIVDLPDLDRRWREVTEFLGYDEDIPMARHNVSKIDDFSFSDTGISMIKRRFAEDYDVLPKITGVKW